MKIENSQFLNIFHCSDHEKKVLQYISDCLASVVPQL